MKESLRTGSEGEILAMKKPVVKQVEEITAEFKAEVLVPQEQADIRFLACIPELTQRFKQFGRVYSHPVSPGRCYVTGEGLKVATVGQQATVILHAMDLDGKEYETPFLNTSCELVSDRGGPTVQAAIQKRKIKYVMSYKPIQRGRHQLHVKVEGMSIRRSPFAVFAHFPIQKLGTPIRTIGDLNSPWGVVVNQKGEIIVAENSVRCISIFSPSGEKIRTFGSEGSAQGQFEDPLGVAVDRDDNILVTDELKHSTEKFTADGEFLISQGKEVGLGYPCGVAVNYRIRKVYVCERGAHQVTILNEDLTFSGSFGSQGSGDGHLNYPWDVALDSTGNVYVVNNESHCIQVFTAEGKFLRKFGKKGSGDEELKWPSSVSIDSDDIVYVKDSENCRVSMFTSKGQFLRSFGTRGIGPGQFNDPRGIAVDRDRFVYVSDTSNGCIQIF